jgi:hypothetical protein
VGPTEYAFADKDENPELPGSEWDYHFSEQNGITKVSITIFNESFDLMEKLIEGFQQGFTMLLNNLEKLLTILSNRQLKKNTITRGNNKPRFEKTK